MLSKLLKSARLSLLRRPGVAGVVASDAVPDDGLNWAREHDAEESAASAIPDDELITVRSILVVEHYPPTKIRALINNLGTLGWDRDRFGQADVAGWVEQARTNGHGGWLNLGIVTRPDSQRWLGSQRFAPLPDQIDHASGRIFQLIPGLTSLVMHFQLTGSAGEKVSASLRRDHGVRTVRRDLPDGVYSLQGPAGVRSQAFRREIVAARRACEWWFREHLPGSFASLPEGAEGFPWALLLTLAKEQPFTGPRDRPMCHYMQNLSLDLDWEVYEANDLPGIRLSRMFSRDLSPAAMSFVAKADRLVPARRGSDEVSVHSFGEQISRGLALWAIAVQLRMYSDRILEIHDEAGSVNLAAPSDALNEFSRLQGELASQHTDAAMLTAGSRMLTANTREFLHEVPDLASIQQERPTTRFFEGLRTGIAESAQEVERSGRVTQEALAAASAIVRTRVERELAHSNINLQRRVVRLTWAILALTAIMLLAVIVQIWLAWPPIAFPAR